jgi:hypothetical protein
MAGASAGFGGLLAGFELGCASAVSGAVLVVGYVLRSE